MNKKTTYELTITGKLQQLALPDMEDAIWARIKTQLDLDLPADDDGGDAPDTPSGGGWWWSAGTFVFVAALVTIFLITKKPTTNQQSLPLTSIENNAPSIPTEPKQNSPQTLPAGSSSPPILSSGDPPPFRGSIAAPAYDSVTVPPTVSLPLPDSGQRATLLAPPPLLLDSTSTVPKRRTKGVTGINDSNYRIVPREDSL